MYEMKMRVMDGNSRWWTLMTGTYTAGHLVVSKISITIMTMGVMMIIWMTDDLNK